MREGEREIEREKEREMEICFSEKDINDFIV